MVLPISSSLVLKQIFFSECLARFIFDLKTLGYGVTFGEAWRPPEMVELYAAQNRGIKNSLHPLRLAVDLNFFKDGSLAQTNQEIAVLWESYSTPQYTTRAGYYFQQPDSDHFSVEHNGVS